MNEQGSLTTATYVYERLRADILHGDIEGSAKLRIDGLCKRYGVGPIPLREALNRLVAEGFVALEDRKGFYLPAVSLDQLHELTNTRCWLNEILLRKSLRCGDAKWEERIIVTGHYLNRNPRTIEGKPGAINREWDQFHRNFHMAIAEACPSRWLKTYHATLFDYADRYRHIYLSAATSTASRGVQKEHETLCELALARDVAGLVEAYNQHIRVTTEIIVKAVADKVL